MLMRSLKLLPPMAPPDPTTGEIWGDAIGASAKRLWSAFPDLSFEIVSIAEAGASRVVVSGL
jgi:hypothetical protein